MGERSVVCDGVQRGSTRRSGEHVADWVGRVIRTLIRDRSGQGTTEYAILVGVLVVIAIVAIIAFRDKVAELWDAISAGINSL